MRAPQPCSLGRQSAFLPGLAPEGIQERAGPPPGPRPAPTSALTGSPSVHQQCPGRGRRGRRSGLRCRGAPRRAVSLRCCGGRGSADPRSQRGPAPAQPPAPSPWLLARGGGRQARAAPGSCRSLRSPRLVWCRGAGGAGVSTLVVARETGKARRERSGNRRKGRLQPGPGARADRRYFFAAKEIFLDWRLTHVMRFS